MIRITNNVWIGGSANARDMPTTRVPRVLNVAQDLYSYVGWPEVEYMQVGLIDGPGNPLSAYYAATLALATLLARGSTLVYCHSGGRSLAVVMMYINSVAQGGWLAWESLLSILMERIECPLPEVNEAHRKAYLKMSWRHLGVLLSKEGE